MYGVGKTVTSLLNFFAHFQVKYFAAEEGRYEEHHKI